ncbi:MAG: stage II sporulation protein P [Oscillibacter sp.]|nr:stage II sporulation protein P [Oscillibacter sp.]
MSAPTFRRRLLALAAAGATLWAAGVTAGSETLGSAAAALRAEVLSPTHALRWELGDIWGGEDLSPAAALTIGESPLLLAAREDVAALWSRETVDAASSGADSQQPDTVTQPVTETPLETDLDFTDNGIPARTLVPSGTEGYTVAGKVYISNSTDHVLAVQDLTKSYDARLTDEGPQILILHTHGSESYTPPKGTDIVYSGNHRTTDTRYNVVHVGDEMAQVFADEGISVIHDRTLYDYPDYSGAYDRSLSAIQTYLAEYHTIHFILDVHRDAIEDSDGNEYKVVSVVPEEGTAAQMTIVVGSDGSGKAHPNWMENLKLGVALQSNLLTSYPSLMRPMLLRSSRYNQHATTGSLLVEVGAAGNSPDEAVLAGRLFARQMSEVLKSQSK